MARDALSAALRQERGAVCTAALAEARPALLTDDRAGMEQRVRALGRVVWGQVITRVIRLRARLDAGERSACPHCGGARVGVERARVRRLQGVGATRRSTVSTSGARPAGRGTSRSTPRWGWARVRVSSRRAGAGAGGLSGRDRRGVRERGGPRGRGARRHADGGGGAAGQRRAGAGGRGAGAGGAGAGSAGPAGLGAPAVEAPPQRGVRAVAVDGLLVQRDDGWPELTVVTVAPVGPARAIAAETGRARVAGGEASYGAGFEEAPPWGGRAPVEVCRRGLGAAPVHTVVVSAAAADWIWPSGRAFLGLPGVDLVEILALSHVYEDLWLVGDTVCGAGTAAAAAWVEPLKTRL